MQVITHLPMATWCDPRSGLIWDLSEYTWASAKHCLSPKSIWLLILQTSALGGVPPWATVPWDWAPLSIFFPQLHLSTDRATTKLHSTQRQICNWEMITLPELCQISMKSTILDHMTNDVVWDTINQGPLEDLICTIKNRKLKWCWNANES